MKAVERRGFALLISLSAVVLLTILILAFFSRAMLNRQISFSSTNQVKADMLARTALEILAGELRQEALNAAATPDPNDGAIPSTQGVDNPDPDVGAFTIAKVSRNGAVVAPGGPAFGSDIGVDSRSLNGRRKSNWFSSGPGLGSADLPTWAYVTRANGIKVPAVADAKDQDHDDYVVGRFAYTVYDTSGMLDANVAGYPVSIPFATPVANFGTKASTTYADLSVLGLTGSQIDELVSWRNASLAASGAATDEKARIYDEWATGIARTTGTPNAEALNAARSGHLGLAAGDNAFFSRSELLRYAKAKNLPEDFSASMVHFSRSQNIPSWGPENITGSSIAYGDDADKPESANRYLPNVTTEGMTVRYYRDDGTYESVGIEDGDPLVTRRFSLAKLAWLGHDGPNVSAFASSLSASERERAIKTCFGLEWNNLRKRWDYNHGNANAILTLDQVRQQRRQPDFFELLKAGILQGSLGGHPGEIAEDITAVNNIFGEWEGPIGRHYEVYSAEKDRHILQIGANIIDQADTNNYPTAVYLDLRTQAGFSPSENDFNNSVFGLENLPMLQRLGIINSMLGNYDDTPGPMGIWIQPELWNPNNSSTAGASPADPNFPTPSVLRIVTYGESYVWNAGEDPGQAQLGSPVDFGDDFNNPNVEGIICFKNPAPGTANPAAFFNNPISIKGFEKAVAVRKYDDATSAVGPRNRYPTNITWVTSSLNNNQFMGVFVGEVHRDPQAPQYNVRVIPDPNLTFVLEYYDGSGWRPYSSIRRIETLYPNSGGSGSRHGSPSWRSNNGHIDPRTDRFSGSAGRNGAGNNYGWNGGRTLRADSVGTIGVANQGRMPIFQAWPRTSAGFFHTPVPVTGAIAYAFDSWIMNLSVAAGNNSVSDFRYQDPDGVTRPGDGWRGDYATGDGIMLFHQDAAGATASSLRRRPVILNRPFRSVGELGYVFRDQPFKTLDFWSDKTADAGLLDLFCISHKDADVQAGQVNPNAATPKVLQALLKGATKEAGDASKAVSTDEAEAVAEVITTDLFSNGPLSNPSRLVSRLSTLIFNAFAAAGNTVDEKPINNKTYGEAPVRALAGNMTDRTWNLLIDVVAQSGRLGAQANGLEDFIVEGERRYWLHVAIDRFTGEVMDRQLEPCYE